MYGLCKDEEWVNLDTIYETHDMAVAAAEVLSAEYPNSQIDIHCRETGEYVSSVFRASFK